MSLVAQRVSQAAKIIDLAIEDQHITFVRGMHGLCAQRGQVEHGQAPMSERNLTTGLIDPASTIVRASMHKRIAHPIDVVSQRIGIGLALENTGYAAHRPYCRVRGLRCRQGGHGGCTEVALLV
jgi:hypothetical protein